jgi:peptidoglycan/LPS O-acetylase OafA/YrhL
MHIKLQSYVGRTANYRPDIDGLRALAVLAVVFYHTNFRAFSGGFAGVDIFFVISGYLITSIIAKDIQVEKFSFVTFYERRMRRIFPALFGVLLFCVPAAAVLLAPGDFLAFGKSLIATTAFASNFYFLRSAGADGYFSQAFNPQPLLHTWSLAVEEQFYLLFPALLILLTRRAKPRIAQFLAVIAVVSFLLSIWLTGHKPISAFYRLDSRAWELLMGSLVAFKAAPPLTTRIAREIAGLAGLGLVACTVTLYSISTPFPGLSAFLPCFGTSLIIYAGEKGPSIVKSVLSFQPLVFIGVISYSLYLWHWPIIAFTEYFSAGDLSNYQTAAVIAGSLLMAFLCFEFIESPFRGADSRVSRTQIFSFGLAASMATLVSGLAIIAGHGLPKRYGSSTRQLVLENMNRKDDYEEVCSNWRTNVRRIDDIRFCNLGSAHPRRFCFGGTPISSSCIRQSRVCMMREN